MDALIYHNDRILPLSEARLSPGQTGLLMGWGVFTTLRIYRGVPFAFERHWTRMQRDAERLGVDLPYEREKVREAIIRLADANRRPESTARLSFVKNQGGAWSQAEDRPPTDCLIFTRELTAWPAANRLKYLPHAIYSVGRYAGAKMLSWVQNVAVLEKAHAEGYDDVLLQNENGHLAECTSANFFLVRHGAVLTPPLSSGCLPGITREVLLEVAARAGFEIREEDIAPQDLSSAEEAFISSSTREVAAVSEIAPQWNYPAPGKTTRALEQAFQSYVQNYIGQAAIA